jgi:hypothetical protein
LTDPNEVLVLVVEPRVEAEAAPGTSGSMEVEVVQKGKAKEE